ncbi:MAG: efflux RND transporter periplasmic adaptor subunit [Dehalococcoidales bacterium]
MKVWKTLLVILASGVLVATFAGCGSKKASTTTTQIYTVKRGDVSNTITAAGNLALAQTEDLPVNLFYPGGTKGTIASVLVQLGDSVKAGQVLVTVDNDEWNDELNVVQQNQTTAQRTVTTKSTAETDAERQLAVLQRQVTATITAVARAQHQVDLKNLSLTGAQLNVTSANNTLYNIQQVKKLQDEIDNANYTLQLAKSMMLGTENYAYWYQLYQDTYKTLNGDSTASPPTKGLMGDMKDLLGGTSTTTSTDVALSVAQKVLAFNQAVSALVDAQNAVDDANLAVQTAQQAVDDANYAVSKQQVTLANAKSDLDLANSTLADAQKKLTSAQAMSPQITAPFDGFITKVNVSGGDQVPNGTIAVTVADPNKFQANILVSEMNIMNVQVGGDATMTLNAIPGLTLPAKVTQISPTATISSGVVNYAVTVNITSVTPVTAGSLPFSTANATGRQPGGASGNFTTQAGVTPPAGAGSSSYGSRAASQLASNIQLKQGLSGTVSLILSQANSVLLVPNNAITKSGNQSTVNVMSANNTIEKRPVQTGLSDYQNTQVTGGLNEGDKIVVTKASSTAPAKTTALPGGGGIFLGR